MIGKALSIGSEAATGSFISQPSRHRSVNKRLEIRGGGGLTAEGGASCLTVQLISQLNE